MAKAFEYSLISVSEQHILKTFENKFTSFSLSQSFINQYVS